MNKIYYVEVCDYESCWYTSLWTTKKEAKKAFDNYHLNPLEHEQLANLGYREVDIQGYKGAVLEEKI